MSHSTKGARGIGAHSTNEKIARGLGWFSIGLGIAELFATRPLTRAIGLEGKETIVRAYGAREIATGVAILMSHDPTPWIWGRVGGDALDLATLATGLEGNAGRRTNLGLAMAAVTGVTMLDLAVARGLTAEKSLADEPVADYSDRTGFPRGIEASRGAARDLDVPADFRIPGPLRPYGT
ncbi:MAG: cyclase dehydrase [Enterovirga sp.]|jgi:hypothetical protein|nr:cyclase dehydrase [Enterovirga sp.]